MATQSKTRVNMAKNILFDFDGTLANTLELAIDYGNENHKRFSAKPISKKEFRERSLKEALSHIGLSPLDLARFVIELKKFMTANLQRVSLFPQIPQLLNELSQKDYQLYIVSSNSKENIEAILKRENIYDYFQEIFSDSSIFGKHQVLKRLSKIIALDSEHALYVGDEVRDFEACKKVGIRMVAVDWGWDDRARLERAHIPVIASSDKDLLRVIDSNWNS